MHVKYDSPFWQFITLCVRYLILNLLFILTCIPILTIGSARAALYSTVFAYDDNEDINLGREYLSRFAREFVRSTASFAIFLLLFAAITFATVFWDSLDTDLAYIVLPILIVAAVIVTVSFEYYFPLQARFANSFKATWSNALKLPWATFGKTLILLAIDVAAIALFVFTHYLRFAFVLIGFSWLAYAKSLIYLKIFAQIQDAQTGGHADQGKSGPFSPEDHSLPTASLT